MSPMHSRIKLGHLHRPFKAGGNKGENDVQLCFQSAASRRRHCCCLHNRERGARLQRLHAITPPKGLGTFDPVSIATGQAQAIFERDPAAAAQVNALLVRTRQLAADCAAFAVTPMMNHGDLNASNLIGPVPMLVDWEYAQLADPAYDLACLSVYYPGLRLRGAELLATAGITDANGAVRLRLHTQLFDSLNRLWEQAEALRQA